jgi:ubiquitin C-terminal hydrolase
MKLIALVNLGNTCYLNSVLQNIIYDPNSRTKILESDNNSIFNKELKQIVQSIDLNEDDSLELVDYNLSNFINYFINEKKFFHKYQQHDAHEFLISFIDLSTKEFTKDYNGEIRLSIKCNNCNTTKHVFEEFNSINLSIPQTNEILTIYQLFELYLKTEIINLYFCDNCKCNCVSEHSLTLWKLPKRLIIVFKRYSGINNNINFSDNLKIKEWCTQTIYNYQLNGIINHTGNPFNGHYTTNVKINNKWFFIDDNVIMENNKSINISQSYILFYNIY